MYGYVVPDKSCLQQKDFFLYRAFYCGMCHLLGEDYGLLPRLTTNYDITFLSVFLHDILSQEVEFRSSTCILNPVTKKTVVKANPLFQKIAAFNIIFAYYSLLDDLNDGGGLKKRAVVGVLAAAYKKAKSILPEVDALVAEKIARLAELEKQNCENIDLVSECFGSLMSEAASLLLGTAANEQTQEFFYFLGKWIYLVDALDDICEDYRRKNYNPFLASYKTFKSRAQFFEDNKQDLQFLMNITTNKMIEHFNGLIFTQSYDLLKNVVYYGFRSKLEELFASKRKLKKPNI